MQLQWGHWCPQSGGICHIWISQIFFFFFRQSNVRVEVFFIFEYHKYVFFFRQSSPREFWEDSVACWQLKEKRRSNETKNLSSLRMCWNKFDLIANVNFSVFGSKISVRIHLIWSPHPPCCMGCSPSGCQESLLHTLAFLSQSSPPIKVFLGKFFHNYPLALKSHRMLHYIAELLQAVSYWCTYCWWSSSTLMYNNTILA